jgi:hypothetical protein
MVMDQEGSCCGMFYTIIIAFMKNDFGKQWNIDAMVMLESFIYISSDRKICWKLCYRRVLWKLK